MTVPVSGSIETTRPPELDAKCRRSAKSSLCYDNKYTNSSKIYRFLYFYTYTYSFIQIAYT